MLEPIKVILLQPRSQALVGYRVTEGGLEPSAIARGVLGEFSRRARRVTSHLIRRRGGLGTRRILADAIVNIQKIEIHSINKQRL